MHKIIMDQLINIEKEEKAIENLCEEYWIIKDNGSFSLMVNALFSYGQDMAGNRFNGHGVVQLMQHKMMQDLTNMKDKPEAEVMKLFEIYKSKSEMEYAIKYIDDYFRKEDKVTYNGYMPNVLSFIKHEFPSLIHVIPKQWEEYLKDSEKFNGQEEEQMELSFQGSKISVGIGYSWQSFPESISVSAIGYSHSKEREPLESLVSAIIHQGYATKVHNNTVEMRAEIGRIMNSEVISPLSVEMKNNIQNPNIKAAYDIISYDKNIHGEKELFKETVVSILQNDLKSISHDTSKLSKKAKCK